MKGHEETGAAIMAVTLWLLAAAMACALVVGIATRAGERARAQATADAVALAGAADGEAAAHRLAAANEGVIEQVEEIDGRFMVRVRVAGVAAEATAERQIRPAGQG